MLRSMRALIFTLSCALGLAGAAKAEDLVVTQFGTNLAGAPWAIAIEKGYFKEAGIDVTDVIPGAGGGTSARNAMASSLGYGEVAFSAALAATLEGQDIKIVNVGSRSLNDVVLLVKPDSPIRSISQLDGKKIAFTNPKSLTETISALAIEKAGLSQDRVQRVALGSVGAAITAMESGSVDVAAGVWIGLGEKSQRQRVLLDAGRDLAPMVEHVGVATGDLIRSDPKKLRGILQARAKAVDFIYANPQEAAKLVRKYYERLAPDMFEMSLKELVGHRHWNRGGFEMDRLNASAHGLWLIGAAPKDVPWDKVLDASFLPADAMK